MVPNLDQKVNDIGSGPESHSLQEEDRGEGRWIKTWFSRRAGVINYSADHRLYSPNSGTSGRPMGGIFPEP